MEFLSGVKKPNHLSPDTKCPFFLGAIYPVFRKVYKITSSIKLKSQKSFTLHLE